MTKSDTIAALAKALSLAQSEIKGAIKDSENPFFKSKYADLESVWESVRVPLTKNGLSITQIPTEDETGSLLETVILHSSGEWISGIMRVKPDKDTPQGKGSAISYARRYSLSAMLSVPQLDDDAEAAMDRNKPAEAKQTVETLPGDFVINFTKGHKGKKIKELPFDELDGLLKWCADKGKFNDFRDAAKSYLAFVKSKTDQANQASPPEFAYFEELPA